MTNEAVIIELMGQPKGVPVRYTVSDLDAYEKGSLMFISGVRAASGGLVTAGTGSGGAFAGIAAEEKVASDGSTTIGCWTKGIFDLKNAVADTIAAGALVISSGANYIQDGNYGTTPAEGGAVIGKALEAAGAGDVIAVAIGIY